ncbi:dihydrofolate reductase [Cardinium endosymbiont of Culicoides punctatus]|uniref:dihydrofolate reductase n=1 Tax=Cardinium endosymbiont of Culicoides punctatus TaxID=2304601 RepID=UPI0010F16A4F|nr:dihydrofolate reductase [Cardinium endosymbiont of Culicoides punctatus]TDG94159.1 Dihydrofolate reductase type 3 [Cardinium endosymbiont of Culicoides punctatus]
MIISIIVATSLNGVIGKENALLWHMPADLRAFKSKTIGHYILMGSRTFHSIGRVLPGRTTIVVSTKMDQSVKDYHVVRSIEDGLFSAKNQGESELFVIGGGEIYAQTLPLAHKIYLTKIHTNVTGDTYFPTLGKEWIQRSLIPCKADEHNAYDYEFITLEREAKKY